MNLDFKLKRVILETSLKHILKGGKKSTERITRNVIELACALTDTVLKEAEKIKYQAELSDILDKLDGLDFETVKAWIIKKFHL